MNLVSRNEPARAAREEVIAKVEHDVYRKLRRCSKEASSVLVTTTITEEEWNFVYPPLHGFRADSTIKIMVRCFRKSSFGSSMDGALHSELNPFDMTTYWVFDYWVVALSLDMPAKPTCYLTAPCYLPFGTGVPVERRLLDDDDDDDRSEYMYFAVGYMVVSAVVVTGIIMGLVVYGALRFFGLSS